jgi:hypothetical protein
MCPLLYQEASNLLSKDIPKALNNVCAINQELKEFTCKNVPTGTRKPGDYIFELTGVSKQEQGEPSSSVKTDTTKIQPTLVPLKIIYLKINGQDAATKYLVPINQEKSVKTLTLSWQVEGGKDIIEFTWTRRKLQQSL